MKLWETGSCGRLVATDPLGDQTTLMVDVYSNFVHLSGDVRMDAESMDCLGQLLMEGAAALRARQRHDRAVDEAFRKALGFR